MLVGRSLLSIGARAPSAVDRWGRALPAMGNEAGPESFQEFVFNYGRGVPYFSASNADEPEQLGVGFVPKAKGFTLTLARDELAAWLLDDGDKNICLWSSLPALLFSCLCAVSMGHHNIDQKSEG